MKLAVVADRFAGVVGSDLNLTRSRRQAPHGVASAIADLGLPSDIADLRNPLQVGGLRHFAQMFPPIRMIKPSGFLVWLAHRPCEREPLRAPFRHSHDRVRVRD